MTQKDELKLDYDYFKAILPELPVSMWSHLATAVSRNYISKDKLLEAIPEKWSAEKIMSNTKAELSMASGFNQAIDQILEALGLGEVQ